MTRSGIVAAGRARGFFDRVRHPEGAASSLQIEVHLRGQLADPDEHRRSFVAARNALIRLDDARQAARKGVQRAAYIGTMELRSDRRSQRHDAC